jgi:outer membrane cobalamin receptor
LYLHSGFFDLVRLSALLLCIFSPCFSAETKDVQNTDTSVISQLSTQQDSVSSMPTLLRQTKNDSNTADANLDKIVVTASRIQELTPSKVTLDTKNFSGKYQDLQSILETVSGVTVRNTGGFGHYAEAAIRGSSANQVQVYLNDIPLNDAGGGAVDISKIPLSGLSRLTVYKTAPSLEFFGENAGGVIDLSAAPVDGTQSAALEVGSFGYRSANAVISRTTGDMSHYFIVNYGYADNNYPYINNRGTTLGASAKNDDTTEAMDNNFFSSFSSLYSNTWNLSGKNKLVTLFSVNVDNEGIFYFPQADSNDGSIRNSKLSFMETWKHSPDSNFTFTLSLKGKSENELFQRFTPFYLYVQPVRERHEIKQPFASVSAILERNISKGFTVKAIADLSYNEFNYNNLYLQDQTKPDFFRIKARTGAEVRTNIINGITARAGAVYRYETDSTNGKFYYSGFVPGGKRDNSGFPGGFFEATASPADRIRLLASVNYGSRSPGFSEKFCLGSNYVGNSDLKPETRLEENLGFTLNLSFAAVSASLFADNTKDKIVYILSSQHLFIPRNMNEITGLGFENDITVFPWDWFTLTNSMTLMNNEISSSDIAAWKNKKEPFVPQFTDDLRLTLSFRRIYAYHAAHYSSPYYIGPDNITKVTHGKPELSIGAGFMPGHTLDISYRLENYLDVRDYDFPDKPIPGIRHYLVLKFNP